MIVFAVILVVVVMRCVVEYVVCVVVTCYVGCCVADGVVVHDNVGVALVVDVYVYYDGVVFDIAIFA